VSVYPPPPLTNQLLNAWTKLSETWHEYYGTWAHLNGVLHKPHPSVCVSPNVAKQRLGRHVPAATNTHNRRLVGGVVFYAVRVLSKESLGVCLCIPLPLLGNSSVNTFPRQWRIVTGAAFYAVRVISKKSRRLILTRTPCLKLLPSRHSHPYVKWL
jgi:hypothetical protein